jgi:hypothetical protein
MTAHTKAVVPQALRAAPRAVDPRLRQCLPWLGHKSNSKLLIEGSPLP